MRCFGTYLTHVQTCDNVRVQSAMQCTASFIPDTCPNSTRTQNDFDHAQGKFSKNQSRGCWPKLQIHTGTVDSIWQSIKDWVPNSLCAQEFGKINGSLVTYCRQWQWRNAHVLCKDLMATTGKALKHWPKLQRSCNLLWKTGPVSSPPGCFRTHSNADLHHLHIIVSSLRMHMFRYALRKIFRAK